jgi:predicted phosphodiesterase
MSKAQRFIVVSDNHGDMADAASVGALWSFMRDWKPEIRAHAGDAYDFRNLRRGASDEEKAASLADDWEAGNDFLRRFFDGGTSNHFLRGNHDERLYEFRNSCSGMLRDYASDGIKQMEAVVKKCRAKMLPYDSDLGVLKLGKLSVLHGFHAGVSACRTHAAIYGSCLHGHIHSIEVASVASREPVEARSIGCMCVRDMDYVNKKTGKLKWAQGWAYGLLYPDGNYMLFQTRNIGGQFYGASEIKTYSA